jgi:hypothetical protein
VEESVEQSDDGAVILNTMNAMLEAMDDEYFINKKPTRKKSNHDDDLTAEVLMPTKVRSNFVFECRYLL